MPEQQKHQDNESSSERTQQIKRRLWRRFLGAGVIFLLAFGLWRAGDEPPPSPEFRAVEEAPDDFWEETEPGTPPALADTPEPTDAPEPAEPADAPVAPVSGEAIRPTAEAEDEAAAVKDAPPEPEPLEEPPERAAEPPAQNIFVVQVGAFHQRKHVDAAVEKLQGAGYAVEVEPVIRKEKKLFRVRVVGLNSKAEAEATRLELIKIGYENPAVIDTRL